MADAAISTLLRLLGNLLIQEVKFLRGVKNQVQLLINELQMMQSFLVVANKKLVEEPRVLTWISQIRKVAQDAEDTIETFLLKKRTSYAKCLCHLAHLHTIGNEVEAIRDRLDAIKQSRGNYGVPNVEEGPRRLQVELFRRVSYWKNDEKLVGLNDIVDKLLPESILNATNGLLITVVEGMGGIGKSTLARSIFNHPGVAVVEGGRFDCRAWVVVSSEYKPEETMKQLIFQLPTSEQDRQNRHQEIKTLEESTADKLYLQQRLQQMLHSHLQGKTNQWESLKDAFPNDQDKQSRLLLTTRNKNMAKFGQHVHKMNKLDNEKSWELFLMKAFVDDANGGCPKELESIGRQILGKCDGLPLAINMVGGLLRGKSSTSEWNEVLNQINSHLGSSESNVSSILELSYLNLSPQLKSCFLSLAFFKEDASIPTKRVVHIWVGQGLIVQQEGRTMDEIGRGYLDELINLNMVEIEDLTLVDEVKNCHLHDLLRDVCIRKAKEEIGFEILKGDEEISPRHCVVHGGNLGSSSLNNLRHLRSLFLRDYAYASTITPSYWESFQLLKTLDLESFGLQSLPSSFQSLIGLKYLRIGGRSNQRLSLPSWLDHLKKLEVLDMEGYSVHLPETKLKMKRLRYIHAVCIRAPMSLDSWTSIETLKYTMQNDWMGCRSRLIASRHVRELGIILDRHKRLDEFNMVRLSIQNMESLTILHLQWHRFLHIDPVVIIPHPANLAQLTLNGPMTKCPDAGMFPQNITHLTLMYSSISQDPMPELGKLSTLLYLKLFYYAYTGERMHVLHDGFPRLRTLSLEYMHRLRGIDIDQGGMPQLKHLRIHDCPGLKTNNLPDHIKISIA